MTTPTHMRRLITSRDGGGNNGMVTFLRVSVSDRVRPYSYLYFYSHMDYCMYPITSIIQLTILSRSSWPRSPRLRCSDAGDNAYPWSVCEGVVAKSLRGWRNSVRRIKGRECPLLECHRGRGFTDMQKPKTDSERFRMHRALRMG